ncbi:MAG: Gfo/Idh/MocA family oxidoreductase [Verrucomicrobiota bacterium]
MNRQDFIKTTTAAAFGFQFIPRRVLGDGVSTPPSRKINLAAIGCGGQAAGDLSNMADENIVALCDVDERRAAGMFNKYPQAKRYTDFRVMLEEMGDKIDAVLVGTPDHTHAVAAMAAMKHGKHVFCEKPLAHTVAEARAMRKEANERKLITQMGNQGHSSETIRLFREWIEDGAIGKVSEIHCGCDAFKDVYCQVGNLAKVRGERPDVPKELAWDLWLGPTKERPYNPAYLPFNWRGWSQFGGGCIGDWVCHVVDPSFWALDLDMPTSILAETEGYDPDKDFDTYPAGTKITYEFPAKGQRGPVKMIWFDGKCSIPRPAELPEGKNVVGTGAVVIGDKGKIMHGSHGAGEVRLIPEAAMQAYKRPDKSLPRVKAGHYRDWLDAIREGRQASSPFDYGARLSEVGLLGIVAIRMSGQKLIYDEKAMRFTNNEGANKFLSPQFRNGWNL